MKKGIVKNMNNEPRKENNIKNKMDSKISFKQFFLKLIRPRFSLQFCFCKEKRRILAWFKSLGEYELLKKQEINPSEGIPLITLYLLHNERMILLSINK